MKMPAKLEKIIRESDSNPQLALIRLHKYFQSLCDRKESSNGKQRRTR